MKVYEVKQANEKCTPLIVDNLQVLHELMNSLEDEEIGSKYTIEVIDMDAGEFYNLGEWGGF